MNDPMTTKKIHKKSSYDPHYSDNWNTPRSAYENILPFVEKYQTDHMLEKLVIWDPFFNGDGGTASEYMRDVFGPIGATIIHENVWVDLNGRIPEFQATNLIITNPPYSKKNKPDTTRWMKELGVPFMSLMPLETTMLKCMRPLLKDDLQLIIPNGRLCFETKDGPTRSAPLGTSWFCFKMNFQNDLNFLT